MDLKITMKSHITFLLYINLLIFSCSTEKYSERSNYPTKTTGTTSTNREKSKKSSDYIMLNDSPTSNGYSLLRNDVSRQHLHVWRGHSSPLLHEHLPILPRARKGQVCQVEVEEFQPLLSMVGHLEPKKFDCSFANGDVIYRHEGNPLINHDHVQVTIFFFRNNNSVVQTVDIMIDIEDPPIHLNNNYEMNNVTNQIIRNNTNNNTMDNEKELKMKQDSLISPILQSRIEQLKELTVKNLRATSESISSDILRIRYNLDNEECRLAYVSPEYLITRGQLTNTSDWSILGRLGGTQTPKLGLPLTSGSAVGGVRRWPLFGQIVHFNRTMVDYIDRDCQEALLQGYRYLHRRGNSYATDYIPIQITIWNRMNDGSRGQQIIESKFLKVTISNAQNMKPPVLRAFRQVNVTHIGGSLSILPRDSISIPRDSIPGWEYLDINMTRMQGPLQAQVVNLRDPTRPVTSFRLADLRQGLIALQLLNYAESLVKVFIITMTAIDPYFQSSQPVNLRIATFLQPVVDINSYVSTSNAPPSFQVFSLPLFTYTGAISLIQKHNIQVVGYIDESMIVYTIRSRLNEEINFNNKLEINKPQGQLLLDSQSAYDVNFGPPHIASMSLAYIHNGEYEPTVERIPLSITIPSLINSRSRIKREQFLQNTTIDNDYSSVSNKNHYQNHGDYLRLNDHSKPGKKHKRTAQSLPVIQLELSIRIVRLYNNINNGALKSGNTFHLPTLSSVCFTAEDFLTTEALNAARQDMINLAFVIKVAPSQGVLVRLPIVKNFTTYHYLRKNSQYTGNHNKQLDMKYFTDDEIPVDNDEMIMVEQQELIEKSQIGVILLSDLETGEVCYLNQRHDRSTDLMGIKQIGRVDFPTVYMTFEIQSPIPIVIVERIDPNVVLRVRETASYIPLTSLHLNYGIEWNIPSQSFEQYNQSIINNLGPENIVYTILQTPRLKHLEDITNMHKHAYIGTHDAGRLVSLSSIISSTHVGDMKLQAGLAINLRKAQVPCVIKFTQRQIDENDIVYVPPTQDIGYTDQDIIIRYTVSGPGGYELNNREIRIQLVAEDNQIPQIKIISPLRLHRDGELFIDSSVLSVSDLDTPEDKLLLQFERLPKYGKILLNLIQSTQYHQINENSNKSQYLPVVKNQNIPLSLFKSRKLIYRQSGDNVKQDDFIITITDGIQTSTPLHVPIEIKPRILQGNKWNQLVNNTILVKENSSVTLTPSVFPTDTIDVNASPADILTASSTAPQYFVIVFPTKGNLLINHKNKVSQFTYKDILENRLTYRHGPAEIGVKGAYDFVRIWDFSAGETFSLNFTLMPVNSQPPVLKSETLLQVKEGDRVEITPYALYATDPDTNECDIQLHVIHTPKWGHIELVKKFIHAQQQNFSTKDSLSSEFDDTDSINIEQNLDEKLTKEHILSFNMQNIRDGLIYYVNSIHGNGQESIEDIFSIKAFDGTYYSPKTIEIKIAIQPTNDEIPDVRLLKYFSVPMNTRKVLTPYLFSVSDMDVPRDMLQIRFTELPIYGSLSVYWQHGEKYIITPHSNPITESYLGMLNLLYLQNGSLIKPTTISQPYSSSIITIDRFSVVVSDGKHTVERQAHVLIRPMNQYPPEMYIDSDQINNDGMILDGQQWTRLDSKPGGLIIKDIDTSEDDLIITILEKPKYGVIQRLPRMLPTDGIVDNLDLIEEAWDIEEMKAGDDLQALAQLSVAGSIGGPKTVKILDRGDQFTKRQITSGRIHYLYTGQYEDQYLTDSCLIRLSDGQYSTDPIFLRFHVRRVNGMNGGLSHSSLPYLPITNLQPLRPLEYPEMKSTTNEENDGEVNQMHQDDALDTISDSFNTVIIKATINRFTFIQHKDIQSDKINDNQIKITFNSNADSFIPSCGLLARTSAPLKSIIEFTDDEVKNHQIVFYALNCESYLNKNFQIDFKLATSSGDYLGQKSIMVLIQKNKRDLPELETYSELIILPYTDTLVRTSHLSFKDKDTNPNHLIYAVTEHGKQNKQYGQLINAQNETIKCFTQSQINSRQILFSSYTQGNLSFSIHLHIFDAGDIGKINNFNQLCHDILHSYSSVNEANTEDNINPFFERMVYRIKQNQTNTITSNEPLKLKVQYKNFENLNKSNNLLINNAPKPETLETILPGHVGFYLDSENIYTLNPWIKFKILNHEKMNCELFNKIENKSVQDYFYQNDLNRRKLVVLLLKDKNKFKKSRKKLSPSSSDTVCHIHYELHDVNESAERKRHSLELSWIKLGFDHKVYTVCPERGLLTLTVIRKGAKQALQSTLTDVYVGLSSDTAIEGKDFSLHSQKLIVFQKGELKKNVLIRFHPTIRDFKQQKLRFYVDLKLPTGAILDRKRRAEVIVHDFHGKCESKSYYAPVKLEQRTKLVNNPVKRDVTRVTHSNLNKLQNNPIYLSNVHTNNDKYNDYLTDFYWQSNQQYKMENDAVKSHISLTDWLATNDLPDSKTLSASYENYMHSNAHKIHCLDGWKFYQHRCYRLYENKEMTWEEARNYCELQDGFLTSITDESNLKWLTETFQIRNPFWIGLHQKQSRGSWVWHNFEHVGFAKWDRGYPVSTKWRSTNKHIKRKRHQSQQQKNHRGPKACVLATSYLHWQNRFCNRIIKGVNFICMKNPEIF
ncbi:unnamed protein product [Schistosoma turkestanicum]|nr:unnamed protein product [Schistosoma turkestanicum]